jgi:hypothetical protein
MPAAPTPDLTQAEAHDLRRLAGFMIPAAPEFNVPGADDEAIFADIIRSLGRDTKDVRTALGWLSAMADGTFADLPEQRAEIIAMALLNQESPVITALGRAVLQCYYRDDRVYRSIGREPRAPFPKGHTLEQGDWTLLDAVRGRKRMWRDVDGYGT